MCLNSVGHTEALLRRGRWDGESRLNLKTNNVIIYGDGKSISVEDFNKLSNSDQDSITYSGPMTIYSSIPIGYDKVMVPEGGIRGVWEKIGLEASPL